MEHKVLKGHKEVRDFKVLLEDREPKVLKEHKVVKDFKDQLVPKVP